MKLFHKGKDAEGQPKAQRPGRRVSRRTALEIAAAELIALVAVDTVDPEKIAEAALDVSINAREPVPANLQQKTKVQRGKKRRVGGYGDSIMAGYENGDIPLTEREAQIARRRGISIIASANAQNGATTSQLVTQYRAERAKSDGKPLDEVQVSAGANNINNDPPLKAALVRLSRDPLNLGAWRTYFSRRAGIRREVADGLVKGIEEIDRSRPTGTPRPDYVIIGTPPIQYARGINGVDPKTGKTVRVPLRGPGLLAKLKQAIAADLTRQGVGAAVDAGNRLQQQGYSATVLDPAAARIGIKQYNPNEDQHFDADGANKLAEERVKLYDVEE